jgi:hypothetical protein
MGTSLPFELQKSNPDLNTITCLAGGEEMIRVGPEGFWVRGVKVEQNEHEAQTVYKAFKEFLTWSQLTRTY